MNYSESAVKFYGNNPQIISAGEKTWIARGANFIVTVSFLQPNTNLSRDAQVDEYMVFLPDQEAEILANGEKINVRKNSLTIVPPGESSIHVKTPTQVIRIFSNLSDDLIALASNSEKYKIFPDEVAVLKPWPTPEDGFKLRSYQVDDYSTEDSNMRIFRCTNLMVNVMKPRLVPRDVTKLSPHSHVDFEQGSLAVRGEWVHYLRFPWGKDLNEWRQDESIEISSPSLTVIPPKVIHTSRNTDENGSWLLDIFSPPRIDFSLVPGKVANENDYPLPN